MPKSYFPTLKEMVMEEYLSDINNDMMVCLLRAGTVVIRCEIWKHFLSVRDGLINKKMDNIPMKSKKKSGKSKVRCQKLMILLVGIKNQTLLIMKEIQALMIQSVRFIQKKCQSR